MSEKSEKAELKIACNDSMLEIVLNHLFCPYSHHIGDLQQTHKNRMM